MSTEVDAFLASLKRCLATPEFLHRFYDAFMNSSQEIRDKFQKTEFPRQTRVLADSLYVLAVAAEKKGDNVAWSELTRLAEQHDRAHLDVRPELYDTWLECLVATARAFDPEMTPEIESAWRNTLSLGIEHLRSRY
ncbi:MAG TPA: globin [Vicinamibacteria bacterium]|nr:globin [Vicinamibacteria bacterium]